MAIIVDENVQYDTTERFYYLTEVGAMYYTGYDITELWSDNTQARLKKQGRQLHLKQIKSKFNAKRERYRHRDLIEYKIFLNANDERQAQIDSLVAIVEISYANDWDIDLFNGKVEWTEAILDPIHEAKTLVYGEIVGCVPEDEYRVGY